MNNNIFEYPKFIQKIFDKLNNENIQTILVGGFVRDSLLVHKNKSNNFKIKDLDVELYGVKSLSQIKNLLEEFGSLNLVGKSFGVYKLKCNGYDLDFSLPRKDNKIAKGHRGFSIEITNSLTFKEASSRRDFTINSLGYDTQNKILLDPFHGREDLQKNLIRAVDLDKFSEDPLRVFRAIVFATRFNFSLDDQLFLECKKLVQKNALDELAKERIYFELEKIFLKSSTPSKAFELMKSLGILEYFKPLNRVDKKEFEAILYSLNSFANTDASLNKLEKLSIFFAILIHKFERNEQISLLNNIVLSKKIINAALAFNAPSFKKTYSDYELKVLATQINIEHFLLFSQAIYPNINKEIFLKLKKRAISLNILHSKQKAFIEGKDLIQEDLKPSKEFKKILELFYDKQLRNEFNSKETACIALKSYLQK